MNRIVAASIVAAIVTAGPAHAQATTTPTGFRIVCLACPAKPGPFEPRKTLLGQHLDIALPQVAHQARVKPILVQTPRGTIVAAVEGGAPDEISLRELEYLQGVFPGFKASGAIDAHQEAHLLAHRFRAVEKDLSDLLELDHEGRVRSESPTSRPLASSHVEVFVFSKPDGFETFTTFLFDRDVNPLVGTTRDGLPTSAMLVTGLKEPGARCRFVFTSALQLLAALSRAGSGLPGWIRVGLARQIEDRQAPKSVRSPFIIPLPGGAQAPADWDAFVADLITAGKIGDLGALAETPLGGLSLRSEAQAWSMVGWMIEKDQAKFAALVRLLLHSDPKDPPAKALLAAVRSSFGHDLVSIVDEWKAAVKQRRAAKR
jgi:hypothetical protein